MKGFSHCRLLLKNPLSNSVALIVGFVVLVMHLLNLGVGKVYGVCMRYSVLLRYGYRCSWYPFGNTLVILIISPSKYLNKTWWLE